MIAMKPKAVKLTVYVPAEMWAEVCRLTPDTPTWNMKVKIALATFIESRNG